MIIFREFMYICDMWLLNRAIIEMDKPTVNYLVVSIYFFALISYTLRIRGMLAYQWGMRLITAALALQERKGPKEV